MYTYIYVCICVCIYIYIYIYIPCVTTRMSRRMLMFRGGVINHGRGLLPLLLLLLLLIILLLLIMIIIIMITLIMCVLFQQVVCSGGHAQSRRARKSRSARACPRVAQTNRRKQPSIVWYLPICAPTGAGLFGFGFRMSIHTL